MPLQQSPPSRGHKAHFDWQQGYSLSISAFKTKEERKVSDLQAVSINTETTLLKRDRKLEICTELYFRLFDLDLLRGHQFPTWWNKHTGIQNATQVRHYNHICELPETGLKTPLGLVSESKTLFCVLGSDIEDSHHYSEWMEIFCPGLLFSTDALYLLFFCRTLV